MLHREVVSLSGCNPLTKNCVKLPKKPQISPPSESASFEPLSVQLMHIQALGTVQAGLYEDISSKKHQYEHTSQELTPLCILQHSWTLYKAEDEV